MKKIIYRVLKNEKIEDIEKKFLVPKFKISKLNKIENVYEGLWLYLEIEDCYLYVVKPFDTFESIAQNFNSTTETIKEYNGVENIFPGLRLYIKKSS